MKTLRGLAVLAVAGLMMSGCDKMNFDFDTDLDATLVADVKDDASDLKSVGNYAFSVSKTVSLEDNAEINDYIDHLKDLVVKSVKVKVSGIPEGQSINALTISVGGTDVSATFENINQNNVQYLVGLSQEQLTKVGAYLLNNRSMTVTVAGTSTYAPVILTFNINHALTVTTTLTKKSTTEE